MYLEPYYNYNYKLYGGSINNMINQPKLDKFHYFNSSLHFKDHLTYLKGIVTNNIPIGVIITDRVFSNSKYKTQLVKKLTNYISQHQPMVENATVKFICLNKSEMHWITLKYSYPESIVKVISHFDSVMLQRN